MDEGEWNLSYSSSGIYPGSDFTFGTVRSGYFLLDPFEITTGDVDAGDTPMPRQDGIRFGQDFKPAATITFEVAVDTVLAGKTNTIRHRENLAALSVMKQAWDAEAIRRRFAAPAVLRTVQGGRARRFYGRPRKFAPAASRLTRQGHTPVVATFACLDDTAYDDVEQTLRVDLVAPPHRGIVGPLTTPLTMTGVSSSRSPGQATISGTKPTWPVITIYGPITQPVCEVIGKWKVSLNLSLGVGERVTIDPRPWARTVLRNGNASVAGDLYRSSPLLPELRLPLGTQDFALRGLDETGTAFMTIAWRDAYAYL